MMRSAMPAVHLKANRAKKIPWKNGRGFTHELAIWPAGATLARDDFDWRVSKATVDEPGPFSIFRGFERVLVVTSGDGIVLSHGSSGSSRSRARLRALEPYRFSGDWPTEAELAVLGVARVIEEQRRLLTAARGVGGARFDADDRV